MRGWRKRRGGGRGIIGGGKGKQLNIMIKRDDLSPVLMKTSQLFLPIPSSWINSDNNRRFSEWLKIPIHKRFPFGSFRDNEVEEEGYDSKISISILFLFFFPFHVSPQQEYYCCLFPAIKQTIITVTATQWRHYHLLWWRKYWGTLNELNDLLRQKRNYSIYNKKYTHEYENPTKYQL